MSAAAQHWDSHRQIYSQHRGEVQNTRWGFRSHSARPLGTTSCWGSPTNSTLPPSVAS